MPRTLDPNDPKSLNVSKLVRAAVVHVKKKHGLEIKKPQMNALIRQGRKRRPELMQSVRERGLGESELIGLASEKLFTDCTNPDAPCNPLNSWHPCP